MLKNKDCIKQLLWMLALERADAGREDNVEQDMDEEA